MGKNNKNQNNENNEILENIVENTENNYAENKKPGFLGKIFSKPVIYAASGLFFLKALLGIGGGDIKTAEAGFFDIVSNDQYSELNFKNDKSNFKIDANTQYFYNKNLKDNKGITGHVDAVWQFNTTDSTTASIYGEANYKFSKTEEAPWNWLVGGKANFDITDNLKGAIAGAFEQNITRNTAYIDTINTILGQVMLAYEDSSEDVFLNFFSLAATGKLNLIESEIFENCLDLKVQAYAEKFFSSNANIFARLFGEINNSQEYLISDAISLDKAGAEIGFNGKFNDSLGIGIKGTYEWIWKTNDRNKTDEEQKLGLDFRFKFYPAFADGLGIEINYNINFLNGKLAEQSLGIGLTFNFGGNISSRNTKPFKNLPYLFGNGSAYHTGVPGFQ
jgi:hypothetical protein